MELVTKSAAIAVTDELTTLIDWTNIEAVSGFTLIVENTGGGSGDDIADVQIDTSEDGGITPVLNQHTGVPATPTAIYIANSADASPDCAGNYFLAGTHNSYPYYKRADGAFYLYRKTGQSCYQIASELDKVDDLWENESLTPSAGVYGYSGNVSGSVSVSAGLYENEIDSGNAKKGSFTSTAKFLRIRAKCNTDKDTTATAYLLADSSLGRICTLADVKDRLGIPTSKTEDDVLISRIISGIESIFDNYTMRKLLLNAVDETIYWTGSGQRIIVPRYPIVAITSIKEAFSDYDFSNADALVANTDYRLAGDGKLLYRIGAAWNRLEDGIEIKYRGGYVSAGQTPATGETAMPNNLREAAIQQASYIYKRRNDPGVTSNSAMGGAITIASAMDFLPMVKETLDKYKRLVL